MASKKIEDGIRSYLESLGHSGKPVVDREAVKALRSQIRSESDPINKLKLLSQLEQEEAGHLPDLSGVEAVFVAEAKAWADTEGVTARALQTLGVPDDVLKQAGFELPVATDRPARSARESSATRAPAIPLDVVAAEAKKLGSGWKVTDLAQRLDREPMTVRNYVLKLIEQGVIADLGDDPKHNGRGRAPKIYGVN
jgi:hypothetical protein